MGRLKDVLLALFPNSHAYANFIMMIVFGFVMLKFADKDVLIVLISGFAMWYCMNEWRKSR